MLACTCGETPSPVSSDWHRGEKSGRDARRTPIRARRRRPARHVEKLPRAGRRAQRATQHGSGVFEQHREYGSGPCSAGQLLPASLPLACRKARSATIHTRPSNRALDPARHSSPTIFNPVRCFDLADAFEHRDAGTHTKDQNSDHERPKISCSRAKGMRPFADARRGLMPQQEQQLIAAVDGRWMLRSARGAAGVGGSGDFVTRPGITPKAAWMTVFEECLAMAPYVISPPRQTMCADPANQRRGRCRNNRAR